MSWVQMEADDDNEPTWLVVVVVVLVALKKKRKRIIKTHPVSQLQVRGWVIIVVVGADRGR